MAQPMAPALPTVDCLMVSLPVPERFAFAKQSIEDYCAQTYPNKRLLLILDRGVDSSREALRGYVDSLHRNDIEVAVPDEKLTLGELRNISMEIATADIVCQWDDDDRSHPQRLQAQASVLQDNCVEGRLSPRRHPIFSDSRAALLTNWRATPAGGHPGTLMARRSEHLRYPKKGETARLGEDLTLALALKARGCVGYLSDVAHLFVYVSHGANSWDDGHHKMLTSELSISKGFLNGARARFERDCRRLTSSQDS